MVQRVRLLRRSEFTGKVRTEFRSCLTSTNVPEEYIPTAFLAPLAAATVCRDTNIQNEYTNVIFK